MQTISFAVIKALHQAGISPTEEDIADIFWLAIQITPEDLSLSAVGDDALSEPSDNDNPSTFDLSDAITEPDLKINEPVVPKTEGPTPDDSKLSESEAQIYTSSSQKSSDESVASSGLQRASIGILTTGASALPRKLDLARALRPLTHRSKSKTQFTLDEQASASQIADLGEAMLVYKPKLERELNAILLIDDWSTMFVWHQTIQELQELFVQLGAFRTLRTYRLSTEEDGSEVHIIARQSALFKRRINPSELIDTAGHTIVFVVTDCASPAWANRKMAKLLEILGGSQHVMILNVLPETQWDQTVLSESVLVYLRPQTRLPTNEQFLVESPVWYSAEQTIKIAFPMVSLEPTFLQAWAQTLTGDIKSEIPGYHFLEANISLTQKRPEKFTDALWQHFRTTTSPTARLLAGYLAAVPLTLPVMRLVQHTMMPDSTQAHLAELLNSFLVYLPEYSPTTHPNQLRWEFITGAREKLLTTVLLGDVDRVFNKVSTYLEKHSDQAYGFYSYLLATDDSSEAYGSVVDADNLPFAKIAFTTLAHLGYRNLANRVAQAIAQHHKDSVEAKRAIEVFAGEEFSPSSGSGAGTPNNGPDTAFQSDDLPNMLLRDVPSTRKTFIREKTFQAVSTLVIGLGGTGLKVATFIKKGLLEANQGQLPREMAFLVLDTEQDIRFQVDGWGKERGDNHATGPVKITYNEYTGLTGNTMDLGMRVREEQIQADANPSIRRDQPNRHISTWFSAKHYIDGANIHPAIWNLDVGAGRYRQFGRMGLFNRIQTVMTRLKTIMRAIHNMGGNRLYVHIVGSLVGGTGAALFIDVAHLVKQIAPDLNFTQAPVIFGHFVLSEGFRGTPQINLSEPVMKADFETRCYAALRELTRLQGPVAKTKGYPIIYDPKGSGVMRGTLQDSLYSAVYLYDGVRPRGSLNTTTIENGLAPAIADAVVAYIDDLSGGAFCSHSVNYRSFYSAHNIPEGEVTYGSIGTYTIELPIYHITEGWSHKLARQVLDKLLEPAAWDKTTGVPTFLATDQPGGQWADPTLEARKWVHEETTSMVARLAEWGEQARRGVVLRQEALNAILATNATVWQHQLALSDPQFRNYVSDAQSELEGSLADNKSQKYYVDHNAASNSAEEKADNLQRDVESKLQLMVGKSEGWRREGGDFRRALVRLGNHHVQAFEKHLIHWLNTHLNGSQVGSQVERKGGKLGFVVNFLTQLAENLESSVSVLREAESVSQTIRRPSYNVIEEQRKELDKTMRRRSGLFGSNLKAYRDKSNELAQFHKADIARQVAHDLVIRVHKSVTQLLTEILLWEQALAKANSAQGGAYALVVEGQTEIDSDRARSKNQVRWVIDDNEPGDVYIAEKHKKYTEGQLERILAQIEWKAGRLDGSGDLRVDFTLNGQLWSRRAGQSGEQKAGLKNVNQLLEACRDVFAPAWSDMSVVAYLTENYYTHGNNVGALAEKVHENGDYLLSRSNRDSDPPMRSIFVRVQQQGLAPNDYAFVRQLRQEVAARFKITRPAKEHAERENIWSDTGEGSRDPFKLTFVLFGELLETEEIAGFISAQKEYRGATGSGTKWKELHILPAETNALSIEKDMDSGNDKVRQNRREFDEEVVAVLEDIERFQLVMRCLAYGETDYAWGIGSATGLLLHKYTPPTNNPAGYSYWRLTATPENRPDSGIRADSLPEHYQLTDMSNNPELLQAFIQLVVVGKDRQNGKEISWQRIEKTVQEAVERYLALWREQMEIGWKAKEARFRQEGEEKAAHTIRLNALLAEIDAFLAQQRWAWSPTNELAPEEIRNDKDKLRRMQCEVDLYTAIRGSVTQEINNLGQRLGQLGTWIKNPPASN